jgi:hypothetical protein
MLKTGPPQKPERSVVSYLSIYFFNLFTVQPDKSLAFGGCVLICFIHRIINLWLAPLTSSNLSSHEGVVLFFVLNSFSILYYRVFDLLFPFTPVPVVRPWWKTISCSRRSTRAKTRSLTLTLSLSLSLSLSLVQKRGDQLTSYPYSIRVSANTAALW